LREEDVFTEPTMTVEGFVEILTRKKKNMNQATSHHDKERNFEWKEYLLSILLQGLFFKSF
jgi:hypothetical protein